jgi:hypothetical protein
LAALAGETGSLNRNSNELLKLRGEVGRLRKEVVIAAQEANELKKDWSAMTNYVAHLPPVKTFVATTMATVPWKQAIVTGGWKTPSGKRAIVLAAPERGEDAQQLTIKSYVLEYAEDVGKTLELPQFKIAADGGQAAYGAHPLTADQFEVLMKAARNNEGVEIVATPTITTANGRMAEAQALDIHSVAFGGQYSTGPVLNFIPTISPDGKSVQMVITARLNYHTQPPP